MRKMLIPLCWLALLVGCAQRIHPAFYDVVRSHRDLTVETNNAVIASIRGELSERTDLSPQQVATVEKLIERLEFIKSQAVIMDRYIETTQLDQDLLNELIKLRWQNPQGTTAPSSQ